MVISSSFSLARPASQRTRFMILFRGGERPSNCRLRSNCCRLCRLAALAATGTGGRVCRPQLRLCVSWQARAVLADARSPIPAAARAVSPRPGNHIGNHASEADQAEAPPEQPTHQQDYEPGFSSSG